MSPPVAETPELRIPIKPQAWLLILSLFLVPLCPALLGRALREAPLGEQQLLFLFGAILMGGIPLLASWLVYRARGGRVAIVVRGDAISIPHMVTPTVHHVPFASIERADLEAHNHLKVTYLEGGRRRVARVTIPLAGRDAFFRLCEVLDKRGVKRN